MTFDHHHWVTQLMNLRATLLHLTRVWCTMNSISVLMNERFYLDGQSFNLVSLCYNIEMKGENEIVIEVLMFNFHQ